MTRSLRGVLGSALALALVAVASACGSNGPSSASKPVPTTVALAPAPPTSTIAEGALDLAAPAGTFPPGMITGFQAASGCQVAMQTWPAGSDPPARLRRLLGALDLVSVRADRLRPLALARLVVPLDPDEIDGMGGIPSRLQSMHAVSLNELAYAVPYAWEPLVLLARRDAFPDGPPKSLRALWEPANGSLVAVPEDPLTLATAALSVGVADPFSLAVSDLAAADELVRLAPPAYRFTSRAQLESLLVSGAVELALGSPRVASALRGRLKVSATVPKEGGVGLVRALALAARAPHPVCAYRFLSYVLEPGPQAAVAIATGLTPAVRGACGPLGRRRCASLHAKDQWGASVQFASRPVSPAAPWASWVRDWRSLAP
ncbi:MAG: putative spermidine/putrescine transport system substrate-binding protein [Gaiellales bacterium]|nr:putative spermidine/putrescine transport system substrate-binding protein [Gaiellales bacterium]